MIYKFCCIIYNNLTIKLKFLTVQASDEDNALITPLVEALDDIPEACMYKVLPSSNAFQWFLSAQTNNKFYYTYPGSLTTTPYSENVIFIVFPNPLSLSHTQVIKM